MQKKLKNQNNVIWTSFGRQVFLCGVGLGQIGSEALFSTAHNILLIFINDNWIFCLICVILKTPKGCMYMNHLVNSKVRCTLGAKDFNSLLLSTQLQELMYFETKI